MKEQYLENHRLRYPNLPEAARVAPRYSDKTANGLTRCIIDYIKISGGQAYRINSQGQYDPKLKRWRYSGMKKGLPDIQAVIDGQYIGIEVKIGSDRQSEYQKSVQEEIESSGGLYFLARNYNHFKIWYDAIISKKGEKGKKSLETTYPETEQGCQETKKQASGLPG